MFIGNRAANSGGAIYSSISTSNWLIDSCRWEYNQCSLFGGALYVGDSHYGVSIMNSEIYFNRGGSGVRFD